MVIFTDRQLSLEDFVTVTRVYLSIEQGRNNRWYGNTMPPHIELRWRVSVSSLWCPGTFWSSSLAPLHKEDITIWNQRDISEFFRSLRRGSSHLQGAGLPSYLNTYTHSTTTLSYCETESREHLTLTHTHTNTSHHKPGFFLNQSSPRKTVMDIFTKYEIHWLRPSSY